ncbi:unnamed protein product [Sphagnum balticum]
MLGYQQVTGEYHEAMKMRNLELNVEVNLDRQSSAERIPRQWSLGDVSKSNKTERPTRGISAAAVVLGLYRRFLLEKESQQAALEIKEHAIRLESMDRTYKAALATKDDELGQVWQRFRGL